MSPAPLLQEEQHGRDAGAGAAIPSPAQPLLSDAAPPSEHQRLPPVSYPARRSTWARVELGPVELVSGPGRVDLELARGVVRSALLLLRECYARNLPDAAARPYVRFEARLHLEPEGRVQRIESHGLDEARGLHSCAARELRALSYPRPEGGPVELRVLVNFEPASG